MSGDLKPKNKRTIIVEDIDNGVRVTVQDSRPYLVAKALAEWCKTRKGQVIVCENQGATWLPFRPFGVLKGQRSKKSEEVIWTNSDECLRLAPLEPGHLTPSSPVLL